jgi:hypothetical protein
MTFHSLQNLTKRIFLIKNRYFMFILKVCRTIGLLDRRTIRMSDYRSDPWNHLWHKNKTCTFKWRICHCGILSNGHCKILMWYTEAYIKNSFVKLKKKDIYLREFKVKKGLNILHRPGIRTLCLLFRSVHLAKTVFSVLKKLCVTSSLSKK